MQIGWNVSPLIPLFPVQPDRQATYPKALGPVFVGKPYLTFPEATPRATDTTLQNGTPDWLAASLEAKPGAAGKVAQPETHGTAPSAQPGIAGSRLNLLV
jgi:hypothetical protein